jgi:heme/copper-type cytochrome/quinol oxidase subunit 4
MYFMHVSENRKQEWVALWTMHADVMVRIAVHNRLFVTISADGTAKLRQVIVHDCAIRNCILSQMQIE